MRSLTLWILIGMCLRAQDEPARTGEWTATGSLQEAREHACAVKLQDGRILVSGGNGQNGRALASAEMYTREGRFLGTTPLNVPRSGHTCTLLNDGRVLAAGGNSGDKGSLEVFDPAIESWSMAGETAEGELRGHTATLLPDGTVLLIGKGITAIFEPESAMVLPTSLTTATPRTEHDSILLAGGTVLVIGGRDGETILRSTEIIDPVAFTVAPGPALNTARTGHSANLLEDGTVVVIGGFNGQEDLATIELLATTSEEPPAWTLSTGKLQVKRNGHIAISVPGHGGILVAGGTSEGRAIASTEVFQGADNSVIAFKDLTAARSGIASAVLDNGVILAMGGINSDGVQRACGVTTVPRVSLSRSVYLVGEFVAAKGEGFPNFTTASLSLDLLDPANPLLPVSIQGRLRGSPTVQLLNGPFSASFPETPIVQTIDSDAGKSIRLTVSSRSPVVTASAVAPVRVATTLSIEAGPSVFEGQQNSFTVVLNRANAARSIGGSIRIEFYNRQGTILAGHESVVLQGNQTFPLRRTFNFTSSRPDQITVKAAYTGDAAHNPSSASADYIFGEKQVDFSRVDLRLNPSAPVWGTPLTLTATGTVFTGLTNPPQPGGLATFEINGATIAQVPLVRTAAGNTFEATATYTPLSGTAVERFTIRYGGDSFYRASFDATRTFLIRQAPVTLSFVNPPAAYSCPGPVSLSMRLDFPSALGLSNRNVQLGQLVNGAFAPFSGPSGGAVVGTLVPSAATPGLATGTISGLLGSSLTNLALNFTGDALLRESLVSVPVTMNKLATVLQFQSLPAVVTNPLQLTAVVTTPGGCPAPGPQGTVQFFDGEVLIGAQTLNAASSASISVSRPAGARTIRARYLGDGIRNPSEVSRSVTFQ